jgi:hypothetical protein
MALTVEMAVQAHQAASAEAQWITQVAVAAAIGQRARYLLLMKAVREVLAVAARAAA